MHARAPGSSGYVQALCSRGAAWPQTSMPCCTCVYFHPWEHPFTFLCAVWMGGLVPWQNSFCWLFTRNSETGTLWNYRQIIIKCGPQNLFPNWERLGPLNHSVFSLRKILFSFSFVKSKAKESGHSSPLPSLGTHSSKQLGLISFLLSTRLCMETKGLGWRRWGILEIIRVIFFSFLELD